MPDLYAELGVGPDASRDELRRAHRAAVRRLHPDVRSAGLDADDAEERLRRLNDAWAVLGDPARRRAYDRQRTAVGWEAEDTGDRQEDGDEAWAWADTHGWPRRSRLRPWHLLVAILLVIFVLTAYVGTPAPEREAPDPPPVTPSVVD